ncbi:ureidoglycolate hydrolase [Aspergillus saccharolyticus JOP 1030-1]|uniref:Ureidoglycolate hydrolase n=1 Tax=Aspergillus saccharolyticus JOP 1030-1 TaxID=1450539 RepID=A0A318ZIK6_9EURO|nr:ureidoglycolate hydrolase [Aspergillus saccharolyticus JOP 1030-1]PYH46617.1 ureidoglycolate hydrolase [Aspergillus saccharolyticus JOP 1030-1]
MAPPTLSSPTPTLTLTPEPLTPSAFSSFGTAITSPLPRTTTKPPPPSTLQTLHPVPVLANQNTALKYSPISPLDDHYMTAPCPSGRASSARMTMFSCFPRPLRVNPDQKAIFDVRILERHPFTTQTFAPLDLSSQSTTGPHGNAEPFYLVIVAPSLTGTTAQATTAAGKVVTVANPPDLSRVRAFVARGGQAVTYAAGTWHAPMVVVGDRRVDFLVVQFVNGVDSEDCQEVVFGEGIGVEVDREGELGAGEVVKARL